MSEVDEKMSIDQDSDSKMSDLKRDKCKAIKPNPKELKQLMEFYFSDSNLSKDRFLKKEIESSSDECKINNFNINVKLFVFILSYLLL